MSDTNKAHVWLFEDGDATCHSVGISGNCGQTCPVFQRGECEEPQDIPDPDGIYCEHTMMFSWGTLEYRQSPYGGWLAAPQTHKTCTKCGYREFRGG